MQTDPSSLIELLVETLLRDLGDEVDLIFRYGSTLKGNTHSYSDLDISFVPVHESTWHSITVLVDDVMVDCYPIHWSKLEQMANFDDLSYTVLMANEIVYQRNEAAGERFRALPATLHALQQPEARPAMLRKAQTLLQGLGYAYFQLREQADAGHLLSCLQQAQQIRTDVLHALAVVNQRPIDTRKLDQVLAMPLLPDGFAETIQRITNAATPDELLSSAETLMRTTRTLLLAEQERVLRQETTFPAVFDAAYPELKGDLQHLMLACERRDLFGSTFISLYHELMIHMAQALTGVEYSDFNCIADYEQDLVALGFPDLLPYVLAKDFDGLHRQCQVFDQRLQSFLTERDVPLNSFATLDELKTYLA